MAIVGVSDRRLTGFVSKNILTNRSTKMTVFGCADAHGIVVYNGIGLDDEGLTPGDWLMQLAEQKLFESGLQQVLEDVRNDLEIRLQKIRAHDGPKTARHTYTFGVWNQGKPEIYNLTNYESYDGGQNLLEGSEKVKLIPCPLPPKAQIQILATGTNPPKADLKAIAETIKTENVTRVVARSIKVVRDVAYRQSKARGTVGAAAQWAAVGSKREEVWCGLDVVGGRAAQEPPNIINIQVHSPIVGTMSVSFGDARAKMLFKDAYAYVTDGSAREIAHYDPTRKQPVFVEPRCGVCGSPWPASHRFCEVCLHDKHHVHGKKQRRSK